MLIADDGTARLTLETLEAEGDEALIERWKRVHALYMKHRQLVEHYGAELAQMQGEYGPAVRREQARWDAEQEVSTESDT